MLHTSHTHLHDRIEILEEENRQLKERIAELTGRNYLAEARDLFGFTDAEGKIFMLLLRAGRATYWHLLEHAYPDDDLNSLSDPENAIRAHVKRMRRKIRPHKIDFKTIYGFGYQMEPPARSLAKRLLEAE